MPQNGQPTVLFLTASDRIGGTERVVVNLVRELASRAWDVRVVFPQSERSAALLAWCRDQGVDAQAHPAMLNAMDPHNNRDARALWRFVHDNKPDVVNLHYGLNFLSIKDVLAVRLSGPHQCVISIHHPVPAGPCSVEGCSFPWNGLSWYYYHDMYLLR